MVEGPADLLHYLECLAVPEFREYFACDSGVIVEFHKPSSTFYIYTAWRLKFCLYANFTKKRYPNVEFEYVDEDCPFEKRRVDSVDICTGCNAFCVLLNRLGSSR